MGVASTSCLWLKRYGFSLAFCFFRRTKNQASSARSAITATPPTTPPAMAPTGVDEPDPEDTDVVDGAVDSTAEVETELDAEEVSCTEADAVEDADEATEVASTPTLTVFNI